MIMPEGMEEVYIGMLGLTDSIPVYDANQNRIKREIVKILNAQGNELAPCLREFHLFTTLVELDLMSNKLVDADLETLHVSCSLRSLNLSNNDLQEVPLNVENGLKNLTKVILQGNPKLNITKCIQNLCGLKKLKHLDLSHTKISTIPEDIRKIQTIIELNISNTDIREEDIPAGVFSLKNLKILITDEASGRYEDSQLEELFEYQILNNMNLHPTDKGEIFWKYSRGHALKLMKKVKQMELIKQWPNEGSKVLELWLNSSMLGSLGEKGVDDLFKNMRNIKGLKQITLLSLCTNDLYQIPNLRHFDTIRQLGLCRNNFKVIPAHILSLPNLTNLYITDNQIETLIFNTDDFPSLVELHLQGNPICRDYVAADDCLESRKNLKHSQCAIQGLKDVMIRGSNLPRAEADEHEAPERNSMHPGTMYPEGPPGHFPKVQNPAIPYFRPQDYPHTSYGVPGYLPPPGGTPPPHYPSVPMSQDLQETDVFKVLDSSYVEDIDGNTERNLRPKIETSDAWQYIADDLSLTRDEQDLLHADSKRDQHKTLTRLLLKKWEEADKSLGSLYRLLIVKGCKQAARILKDGVVDNLQAKGELKSRVGEKAAAFAPPPQRVIPGVNPYDPHVPYAGHYMHQPVPQQMPMYEASGYPTHQQMVPPYQDPRQGFQGPPPPVYPQLRDSPPPSYSTLGDTRSRRTSQPESSLGTLPSDYKLPDMMALNISNQPQSSPMGPPVNYPQGRQMPSQDFNTIDFFGKRPSAGSISSLPATENQNLTGSPRPQHRRSVDNTVSFVSVTEVKQVPYREQESLQRSQATIAMQAQGMQGQYPVSYTGPAAGSCQDAFQPQRRVSEESNRLPCQSDDPSMIAPVIDYRGAPQQSSMQASVGGYPMMSDTQEPVMTDETMYRKVLASANSTDTEPPGFSDEAVLRKELSLHQNS